MGLLYCQNSHSSSAMCFMAVTHTSHVLAASKEAPALIRSVQGTRRVRKTWWGRGGVRWISRQGGWCVEDRKGMV